MTIIPLKTKEKAVKLREKGYSIKEIADKLHIAKSTSSIWARDIKLSEEAIKRLKNRRLIGYYNLSLYWGKKRIKEEKKYNFLAHKIVSKIKRDYIHNKLYCALLYWCEGGKGSREGIRFINSDPALIKTFLYLLRNSFNIDERKLRILMHLHDYHNEDNQKKFWSDVTKISKNQFYKTFRKSNTKKRIKNNYPGCVVIHYNDCKIIKELIAIYRVFSK